MSKSHVSMEQKMCPVCGKIFDSGAILLDMQLKESMEHCTVTGYDLCEEHKKLWNDGYIALVVCKNKDTGRSLKMEEADRTGELIHIRKSAFKQIITGIETTSPMIFISEDAAQEIKSRKG